MNIQRILPVVISFCLVQGLLTPSLVWAEATVAQYHVDKTLPASGQSKPFKALNSIALAPDGSLWVIDGWTNGFGSNPSNIRAQHLDSADGHIIKQLEPGAVNGNTVRVAADGSLWTAGLSDQIRHISANGDVIAQFGIPVKDNPYVELGIDLAKDGSLWVAHSRFNAISHYNAKGELLGQLTNNCTDIDQIFVRGGGARAADGSVWQALSDDVLHLNANGGHISGFRVSGAYVSALALAADGSLWMTDTRNKRLLHYTKDGSLIKQVDMQGSTANEDNPGKTPSDIAIAADGSLWVADDGNHRIQHLTANGEFIGQFGGLEQFPKFGLGHIALAADGGLWVSAYNWNSNAPYNWVGNSLKHFKSDGSLIEQIVMPITGNQLGRIAVVADGSLWVENDEDSSRDGKHNSIHHFTTSGTYIESLSGTDKNCVSSRAGQFNSPQAVAQAADGSVWVADTGNHRLQHFDAQGHLLAMVGDRGYLRGLSEEPTTPGTFQKPTALALAPDGSVWVLDTLNHRLQHFTAEGKFIAVVGSKGTAAGQFLNPTDIAIAKDGSLWVTDAGNRIQHLSQDGHVIKQFGSTLEAMVFDAPNDLAFAQDGSLWVGNNNSQALIRINQDGEVLERFGETASNTVYHNPVAVPVPHGILKADDGSIWRISSKDPTLIQRVDHNSQVLAEVSVGGSPSQVNRPVIQRIETAKNGSVWVTSFQQNDNPRINGFSWVGHYTADGQRVYETSWWLANFAVAADSSIWVTGQFNDYTPKESKHSVVHFDTQGQLIEYIDLPTEGGQDPLALKGIAIAPDGALWVSDPSNHRILKLVQGYPASYDDKNQILTLNDVQAGGIHYQATLKQHGDLFSLLTLEPAAKTYSPAANFNVFTRLLTLPLVRVLDKNYQAQFKYLGDSVFELQAVTLK